MTDPGEVAAAMSAGEAAESARQAAGEAAPHSAPPAAQPPELMRPVRVTVVPGEAYDEVDTAEAETG
jgi:hypothetical protein